MDNKLLTAEQARIAANKQADAIRETRIQRERQQAEDSAKKWREERINWENNHLRWITSNISEAVRKGRHSTSIQMEARDEKERSGEEWFWASTPFKDEMKRVMKHFEKLGYKLEFYVYARENIDLSELGENWITYETRLRISW